MDKLRIDGMSNNVLVRPRAASAPMVQLRDGIGGLVGLGTRRKHPQVRETTWRARAGGNEGAARPGFTCSGSDSPGCNAHSDSRHPGGSLIATAGRGASRLRRNIGGSLLREAATVAERVLLILLPSGSGGRPRGRHRSGASGAAVASPRVGAATGPGASAGARGSCACALAQNSLPAAHRFVKSGNDDNVGPGGVASAHHPASPRMLTLGDPLEGHVARLGWPSAGQVEAPGAPIAPSAAAGAERERRWSMGQ
jgi:hypothetical protein